MIRGKANESQHSKLVIVTPEMIAAGADALLELSLGYEPVGGLQAVARDVFLAMAEAQASSEPVSQAPEHPSRQFLVTTC